MAKNKRVFEVAKALGVTSKDIISKCDAEEIPGIKNHMSTVSLGLAATISEWFSDSGASVATAVQTAAPVDVKKARAKARKKASPKASPTVDEPAEADKPQADVEAPSKAATSEPRVVDTKEPTSPPTGVGAAPVEVPAVPDSAETTTPPVQEPVVVVAEAEATSAAEDTTSDEVAEKPKVVMNVPVRPDEVKPVGPMLQVPSKTKLSGPRVIRVEAPDVLPAPRPRRERGPGEGMAPSSPRTGRGAAYSGPDEAAGGGGDGRGRNSRRNKRRTPAAGEARRTARGGAGVAPTAEQSSNWRQQDLLEREQRLNRSGGFLRTHRRDSLKRSGPGQKAQTAAQTGGAVTVTAPVTIKELSVASGVKANQIIKKLFMAGTPATINSTLDAEHAVAIMLEYSIELEIVQPKSAEELIKAAFTERKMHDERQRAPVVTILGHVDHGKTSLLDRIRDTNVAEGEAGGITQATSAFRVPVKAGDTERTIVFLDTPGHEAFTEMRSRGAKVTDVVILVVAADDGVMPQTLESINHAKAAGVPLIVALNKVDKPEATEENIQRIFGQLAEQELNPTEWGGQTEIARISALKGEGVQELLDLLDFQAQLNEWTADFAGPAEGSVIEAQLEEGRGPVARLLVQQGQLKKGDFIVIGRAFGRVRDIINDRGERVDEAGPSTPVAVSGISVVPDAGDRFYVAESLKAAEAAAGERRESERQRELAQAPVTLDNIFEKLEEGSKKELNLIVKADVQGSVETLKKSLEDLSLDEVKVTVLHSGVGGVNESDITLAAASNAIIIGFNVTTSAKARQSADQKSIDVRLYEVIYDITDDVQKAAKGLLDPIHRLDVLGHAEVRQVFKVSKIGMVAGCYVTDGIIERSAQIRVTRDGIVVEADRRLEQLKRFKDDAREVRAGQECGMKIDGYSDIKEGDVLECYKTVEVERE